MSVATSFHGESKFVFSRKSKDEYSLEVAVTTVEHEKGSDSAIEKTVTRHIEISPNDAEEYIEKYEKAHKFQYAG